METLRGILGKKTVGGDDKRSHLVGAREHFARGDPETGFQLVLILIDSMTSEEIHPACKQILLECAIRLREFSHSRLEYAILAIVAMEKCL